MMCSPQAYKLGLLPSQKTAGKMVGQFGARIAKAQKMAQSTSGGGTPAPSIFAGLVPGSANAGVDALRKITSLGAYS